MSKTKKNPTSNLSVHGPKHILPYPSRGTFASQMRGVYKCTLIPKSTPSSADDVLSRPANKNDDVILNRNSWAIYPHTSRRKDTLTSCVDMTCAHKTDLSQVMQCVNHDGNNLTNEQKNSLRTDVSVFMCAVFKVFRILMVALSLVSCSVPPRTRNAKYRFLSLWILMFTFCTCSQTVCFDGQFLFVANCYTLLHREKGSFEVLSWHSPSVTIDR